MATSNEAATGGSKRLGVLGMTFLLALAILYEAAPRTIAAVVALPGDEISLRIRDKQFVSIADLETLIASRREAVKWVDSGQLHTDLGLAQLMLAVLLAGDGELDKGKLHAAIASLRQGLSLAPARPHAWTRLAYAVMLARGPSTEVAKALEMALVTAPYAPDLLFARLRLGLQTWDYLPPDTRGLVHQQVRTAWSLSGGTRRQLLALVRDEGGLDVVRTALSRSGDDLAGFEKLLKNSPARK